MLWSGVMAGTRDGISSIDLLFL